MEDRIESRWRKSSYSGNGGANCVEVATNLPSMIAVRDSKNRTGPALSFARSAWAEFIGGVKAGELDLTS